MKMRFVTQHSRPLHARQHLHEHVGWGSCVVRRCFEFASEKIILLESCVVAHLRLIFKGERRLMNVHQLQHGPPHS